MNCFLFVYCCVFFGIACYSYSHSLITEIVNCDLKFINQKAASHRNRSLTVKLVADFIETHSYLKKLRSANTFFRRAFHMYINFQLLPIRFVYDNLSIYQVPVLAAFVLSLVTMCSAMLLIQMQMVKSPFSNLMSFLCVSRCSTFTNVLEFQSLRSIIST